MDILINIILFILILWHVETNKYRVFEKPENETQQLKAQCVKLAGIKEYVNLIGCYIISTL